MCLYKLCVFALCLQLKKPQSHKLIGLSVICVDDSSGSLYCLSFVVCAVSAADDDFSH